jgi:hypothetical protein
MRGFAGARFEPAVKARAAPGVAGAAVAADFHEREKGVLIAVNSHLDEPLGLTGRIAFAP